MHEELTAPCRRTRREARQIQKQPAQHRARCRQTGDLDLQAALDVPTQVHAVVEGGERLAIEQCSGIGIVEIDALLPAAVLPVHHVEAELVGLPIPDEHIHREGGSSIPAVVEALTGGAGHKQSPRVGGVGEDRGSRDAHRGITGIARRLQHDVVAIPSIVARPGSLSGSVRTQVAHPSRSGSIEEDAVDHTIGSRHLAHRDLDMPPKPPFEVDASREGAEGLGADEGIGDGIADGDGLPTSAVVPIHTVVTDLMQVAIGEVDIEGEAGGGVPPIMEALTGGARHQQSAIVGEIGADGVAVRNDENGEDDIVIADEVIDDVAIVADPASLGGGVVAGEGGGGGGLVPEEHVLSIIDEGGDAIEGALVDAQVVEAIDLGGDASGGHGDHAEAVGGIPGVGGATGVGELDTGCAAIEIITVGRESSVVRLDAEELVGGIEGGGEDVGRRDLCGAASRGIVDRGRLSVERIDLADELVEQVISIGEDTERGVLGERSSKPIIVVVGVLDLGGTARGGVTDLKQATDSIVNQSGGSPVGVVLAGEMFSGIVAEGGESTLERGRMPSRIGERMALVSGIVATGEQSPGSAQSAAVAVGIVGVGNRLSARMRGSKCRERTVEQVITEGVGVIFRVILVQTFRPSWSTTFRPRSSTSPHGERLRVTFFPIYSWEEGCAPKEKGHLANSTTLTALTRQPFGATNPRGYRSSARHHPSLQTVGQAA